MQQAAKIEDEHSLNDDEEPIAAGDEEKP